MRHSIATITVGHTNRAANTYFKVKSKSGGIRGDVKFKDNTLVSSELFTISEMGKHAISVSFVQQHFERVIIPNRNTYFFFGARFSKQSQS